MKKLVRGMLVGSVALAMLVGTEGAYSTIGEGNVLET
jgi:hypothetical protein